MSLKSARLSRTDSRMYFLTALTGNSSGLGGGGGGGQGLCPSVHFCMSSETKLSAQLPCKINNICFYSLL